MTAACRAHPRGLDHGASLRHRRLDGGRALRLSGNADLTNPAAFAALTRRPRPGDTLDITAMTFLDARALTTIVHAAAQVPGLDVKAGPTHTPLLDLIRSASRD